MEEEKDEDENLTGKLLFTVKELLPNETIHIAIPCIVETKEGKFSNNASLTKVNGLDRELKTDTAWHEVRRYDVDFGKKVFGQFLGSNGEVLSTKTTMDGTERFLPDATLTLLDSSGLVVERVDADGKPTPVPGLLCETEAEKLDYDAGMERRAMRHKVQLY
jgi:hypothetical protein